MVPGLCRGCTPVAFRIWLTNMQGVSPMRSRARADNRIDQIGVCRGACDGSIQVRPYGNRLRVVQADPPRWTVAYRIWQAGI